MVTPFVNPADMAISREGFSSSASAPWGFAHNGIDFMPAGDQKAFQAVAAGSVEEVRLWPNDQTGRWQVNVRVRYSTTFAVEYSFEPFSSDRAAGDAQLASIVVTNGQRVSQGEVIGRLRPTTQDAHVHFGLMRNNTAVCPEPYFTPEARAAVLTLIQKAYPSAQMCY